MDNGSYTRPAVSLLKELYQHCKRTRVTWGQGDNGDVLAYSRDLEDRVTDAILDGCEPGEEFEAFSISISSDVAVRIERSKEDNQLYTAWLEGTYTYHGKPTTSIQVIHTDPTFVAVMNVAKAYQKRRGYKVFLQGDLAKNAIIERANP